jgi:hypothetical protein
MAIMNDPAIFHGKIKVTAVSNEEIRQGNYDAVLVPISGYRSNFLFDLYTVFLREPDFGSYAINLKTHLDDKGKPSLDDAAVTANKNFFRLDLGKDSPERAGNRRQAGILAIHRPAFAKAGGGHLALFPSLAGLPPHAIRR